MSQGTLPGAAGEAVVLPSSGVLWAPWMHLPAPVSHVKPWGQQWTWSSQHTASGNGQHPQLPDCRRQQVLASGQLTSPSHFTSCTVSAGSLVTKSVVSPFLERHLLICKSHIVPSGQQCWWSGQQMAFGNGQQPNDPLGSWQQVVPSEHWERASGQITLVTIITSFSC